MLHEFEYFAPDTVGVLLDALADHPEDGALLAGGTDLLPNIRNGLRKPAFVIDTKRCKDAPGLDHGAEGLSIGPAVTISDLLRDKGCRDHYPVLCSCAHELASHQVRNRATVFGNVVNASPCADMAPALLCLGATAELRSRAGTRELPFSQFFTGVKRTALRKDEFLYRIKVPAAAKGAKGSYLKLKRIQGHDLGIVGVLLVELGDKLRFGVSSAAPTPVLVGDLPRNVGADEAVAKVLSSVSPIDDVRSTKDYREYMIGVYVRRLLEGVKR